MGLLPRFFLKRKPLRGNLQILIGIGQVAGFEPLTQALPPLSLATNHLTHIHHFINFIIQAIATMPTRIGSNWGGVIFTVIIFAFTEFVLSRWGDMRGRWGRNAIIGLAIVGVGWTLLFLVSAVLTVYDDHQDLAGAAQRLKKEGRTEYNECSARIQNVVQPLQTELGNIKTSNAVKDGINQTIQKQNRDQQGTINGCLSQAMKLLTPEELKITAIVFDKKVGQSLPVNSYRILVMTNKTMVPVNLTVSCNMPIGSLTGYSIGDDDNEHGVVIGGSGRLTDTVWGFGQTVPPWTPTRPLVLNLTWKGGSNMSCSINTR